MTPCQTAPSHRCLGRAALRCLALVSLLTAPLACGGGGGGASQSAQTIPFAKIAFQNVDLPASAEPGTSVHGTLHFTALTQDYQELAFSSVSSDPGLSVVFDVSAIGVSIHSTDYSVGFVIQVGPDTVIGSNGQFQIVVKDHTRDGHSRTFTTSTSLPISDYAFDLQVGDISVPADVLPGAHVKGTADIQVKGPVGTILNLSAFSNDPALNGFTVSPSTINVHAPQTIHCTVTCVVATEAAPASGHWFTLLAGQGSQAIAKDASFFVYATAMPVTTVTTTSGLSTYNPGASTTFDVNVGSAYGFSGPVTLGTAGLPSGVTASWNSSSFDLPLGGGNTVQLTLTFPRDFVPQSMTPYVLTTGGGVTRLTPIPLDNLAAPRFSVKAASGLVIKAGTVAQFPVEVQSLNGFSAPVTLSLSGYELASFSPAIVTPPANGIATSMLTIFLPSNVGDYLDQYPLVDELVYIGGQSGTISSFTMTQFTATDDPIVQIEGPTEVKSAAVGQTVHWQFKVRSINGYSGSLVLSDSASYGLHTTISPSTVALAPGGEVTVDCDTAVLEGDFSHQFRDVATAGVGVITNPSTLLAGSPAQVLWVMDNPNFEIGHPAAVTILSKGGSATASVPLVSVYNFAASVSPYAAMADTTGTTLAWDNSYFDMQAGTTTPLSVTFTDAGLSSYYSIPGTYKCMVSLTTPNNAPVNRYATGYFPYVLTDSVTPDFYVIPDRTQVHALTPGTSQVTVKVGSVAGFSGTVHLALQSAVCGWSFDTPDVVLASGEEKTVTLTLTFGALSGLDMDMPLVGTGSDGTTRSWTLHLMSDPVH